MQLFMTPKLERLWVCAWQVVPAEDVTAPLSPTKTENR